MSEAVEGYLELASWWVDAWGTHASKMAAKLDAGTYTADDGVADVSECASLAAESLFLFVNEAFDAAATLSGQQDEPHIVTSLPFSTTTGVGPASSFVRILRLDGPLVAALGTDSIAITAVELVPSSLNPGQTEFVLEVNATGHAGVTYTGSVSVFESGSTTRLETIQVWVSVP